ncbi:MAG: hypothetical protein ACRBBS_05595 [Thalassovita sp.]
MSRKFIASILAASIAVTGLTAAPAKAGNDDLVRFLAGATALVIIGRALDSDNSHASASEVHVRPGRAYDDNHRYQDRRNDPRSARDSDRRTSRYALPRQCRSSFWTPDGRQRYLDRRCLKRNYDFTRDLPKRCKIKFFDNNVKKSGYSIRCLKDNGYRMARN